MRNFFKHITKIGLLTGSLFLMGNAFSQCANNNTFWQNAGTPGAGATVSVAGTWGGEYITVGVVSGSVYTISTCGGGTWDSQLTLYNNLGGSALGYNDDFCGVQSQINWTATFTGTLRVLLDQFSCASNTSPMTITITRNASGGYNPCSSITTLSCGASTSANNTAGNGAWNTYGGPFSVPGRERIFQFTPTITGTHSITVTSGSGYLDLFYKTASGCNSSGWTYVDDIIGTATNNVTFTAGTTYYIMLDDEDINATTASIVIGCPSPAIYNPCSSIGSLSCGVTTSVLNPAGNGAWSSFGGPFTTPGTEKLYTFTAPYTGTYNILVNHSSSGYVDLFYKQSASGCNNSGWTYVDDILTTATNTITLTGGVTYYIMLDDEDVSASSSTINITCPPPPCVGSTLDGSYTYSAPFVISGNTTGACNNSSLRLSQDLTYAVTIGCAGNYTFSLCEGATWDTYLYLTNAAGGGTIIGSNDDACSLQSSVSAFLNPGTYYISVEGFSETSSGAFTLSVSGSGSPPTITGSSANVSCFGGNNGSVTASISGNGNSPTATLNGVPFSGSATGLTAGSYTLVATNCWGSTSQIFIVNQPAALAASSSSGSILCNGETTMVSVTASGGTAPYSGIGNYSVGAGLYSYTVTDVNGCSASTSVNVIQPLVLAVSSSSSAILCNGEEATVTVSAAGGTAPYNGIGNYSVVAGSYSYTVTDANGCSASTSVNISEPSALSVSSSNTSILCNNGNSDVTVTAVGGTAPYTGTGNYSVGAGSYSYTVTDANGCSASTSVSISEPSVLSSSSSSSAILCNGGEATVSVTAAGGTAPYIGTGNYSVTAGAYSYTVTDANGCSSVTSVNISEPSALSISSSNTAILCSGGSSSITISAAGGTAPYNGTGNYTVGAGAYTYTVTDANGCSVNTIVNITEPSVLSAASSNTAILCNGESSAVTVTAAGGTAPYTGTGNYTVYAGTYTYIVTDANGCSANTSVNISEPSILSASSSNTAILCNGGSSVVNVTAAGGTTPYTGTGNYTVSAGSYTYTVTDANGCSANTSVSITAPSALVIDAIPNQVVYYGYSPLACANLTANVTGGIPAYTYNWSNGATTNLVNVCPSSSQTYTVTATDANGCTASTEAILCVVDVVCFAGGSSVEKVQICHNGNTLCVSPFAIPSHLAHGDVLGACGENEGCFERGIIAENEHNENIQDDQVIYLEVYPNPIRPNTTFNISISSEMNRVGTLEVMDISGKIVRSLTNINLFEGELYNIEMQNYDLKSGIYIIRLITDKGEVQSFKLVQN